MARDPREPQQPQEPGAFAPPARQKPAGMATYKRMLRKAIRKADDGQVLFPEITFGVPK